MYRVLRPVYIKTGEVTRGPDGREIRWERVHWLESGYAHNMTDAKRRFGGSPVLEGDATQAVVLH